MGNPADDFAISPAAIRALAEGDLDNFVVASTPGGIEEQEAQGQRDINSAGNLLPKNLLHSEWSDIEALGIKRLGDHDDLFFRVELPVGWSIRPTVHPMWSDVIDGDGKVRLNVFYKAAFYDRRAHFWISKD